MKKLLRKLMHARHGDARKFKKILIVLAVATLIFIIGIIVLAVLLIGWLFNQGGGHLQNASTAAVQQAESLTAPLKLETYVQSGNVDTAQLEQAFNAVPAPLQGLWISQFESQLNDLKSQAGITDANLQILQALLDSFKQSAQ